jgi:hypothetical protein
MTTQMPRIIAVPEMAGSENVSGAIAWRAVAGYAYEVSELGHVRRVTRSKGARAGRVLKPTPGRVGHLSVELNGDRDASGNRVRRRVYVHRLVLEAFVGPCPVGCEALHRDGNPANNTRANLRWGTHTENMRDACAHGTTLRKLTPAQVESVLIDRSKSGAQFARELGVNRSSINRFRRGVR